MSPFACSWSSTALSPWLEASADAVVLAFGSYNIRTGVLDSNLISSLMHPVEGIPTSMDNLLKEGPLMVSVHLPDWV